jgi:polyhydroxyalkanoate synthesis regulator protein
VISLRKKVVDLEQKNKINQNTIEAMDEQRRIKDEMFEERTRKLLDDERHRLILELEEARTSKSNDIQELRKTIDELKSSL